MEEDWQNDLHKLKHRGKHLLETEKWADCRFLVGTQQNQRIISAHKLLLAMSSPVFERMFYGNLPETNDRYPISIPDVQPDAFQTMLEYIYTDRININSFDKACELCYVAKKYMLPHVVQTCSQYLWDKVSPQNACRAYEFAKLFEENHLLEASKRIIAAEATAVLEDPSFLEIEVSTLMDILDMEELNIKSELDLFNALVRYATERGLLTEPAGSAPPPQQQQPPPQQQANCSIPLPVAVEEIKMEPDVALMMQNQADDSFEQAAAQSPPPPPAVALNDMNDADVVVVERRNSAGNEANKNNVVNFKNFVDVQRVAMDENMLREAVKKIRFLTMKPYEFATGPARSKLLQQNEALAILIRISSPDTSDYPLPEGFCTSFEPRKPRHPTCDEHLQNVHAAVNFHCNHRLVDVNNGFQPIDAQVHANVGGMLVNNLNMDSDMSAHDARRSYCVRTLSQHYDYRNTSVTDSGVTFKVDTNIWVTGVQVPTQVLSGELMNSAGFQERYLEVLYAHIQDMQGSRLSYTHHTSRVRYDSVLEITFDRPVYIYRNQTYKVFVVFNKMGWYPMYTCVPEIVCNRVKFMFNVGNPVESVRDGLIRAIVFTTPQDQYQM